MNRQQFLIWMNDPATLNSGIVEDLRQITIEYPYFQTARMLHLINLKLLQDYRFDHELRQVAACAADRGRLRKWLKILVENENEGNTSNEHKEIKPLSAGKSQQNTHLKDLEEQIKTSLEEIERKKSHLKELIEKKKAIIGDPVQEEEELQGQVKELPLRPLPKDELLEEFIKQKQEQSQKHVTFYSPEESARRSIEENEGVLSETLARLIAAQGKKERAIKIYQQLMLKNPQKSGYFAAQIEKLRKNLKN